MLARTEIEKWIKTAVVVSDNPNLRNDLQNLLTALDIETIKMASGRQAYQWIATERIRVDLVFCDSRSSDIGGAEFLGKLGKNPRFSPVIRLLTAEKENERELTDFCARGLCGFINKPFSMDALIHHLTFVMTSYLEFGQKIGLLQDLCLARAKAQQGDHLEALDILQSLDFLKETAIVNFEIGKCLRHMDNHAGAGQRLTRAVVMDPALKPLVGQFLKEYPLNKDQNSSAKGPGIIARGAYDFFALPLQGIDRAPYRKGKINHALIALQAFEEKSMVRDALGAYKVAKTSVARSIQDIIGLAQNTIIDLIISDFTLPDGTGIDLLQKLAQVRYRSSMRVVFVMKAAAWGRIDEGFDQRADGYCSRPFTASDMIAALETAFVFADLTGPSAEASAPIKKSWFYFFKGDASRSLVAAERACEISSDDAMAQLALAMAIDLGGERDVALACYKEAQQRDKLLEPAIKRVQVLAHALCKMSPQKSDDPVNPAQEPIESKTAGVDPKGEPKPNQTAGMQAESAEHPSPKMAKIVTYETGDVPETKLGYTLESKSMPQKGADTSTNADKARPVESDRAVEKNDERGRPNGKDFAAVPKQTRQNLDEEEAPASKPQDSDKSRAELPEEQKRWNSPSKASKEYAYEFQTKCADGLRQSAASPSILDWLKPEELDLAMREKSSGKIRVVDEPDVLSHGAIKLLAEQATLCNGRIVIAMEDRKVDPYFFKYVASIGEKMRPLYEKFGLSEEDPALQKKIDKLLKESGKGDNEKKLFELGQFFMASGVVDRFFAQAISGEDRAIRYADEPTLGRTLADLMGVVPQGNAEVRGYFDEIRNQLLISSLGAQDGTSLAKSLFETLGGDSMLSCMREGGATAAFFDDLRNKHIMAHLRDELTKRPDALAYLQSKLPAEPHGGAIIIKDDKGIEALFDKIIANNATGDFTDMLSMFQMTGPLFDTLVAGKGRVKFVDTLIKEKHPGVIKVIDSGVSDFPMFGGMLRAGGGAEIMDGLFAKGGIQFVEDIIRDGGGIRLLEQTIESPFADLVLGRITDKEKLGGFIALALKSPEAVAIMRGYLPYPEEDIEDALAAGGGREIISRIIEAGDARKLLRAMAAGPIKEVMARTLLYDKDFRDVMLEALRDQTKERDEQAAESQIIAKAMMELKEPICDIHRKLFDAREDAANCLEDVLKEYGRRHDEKWLVSNLSDVLKKDHYSLQSFKKSYKALMDLGLEKQAEDFFDKHYKLYAEHDGLRDSLCEFLKKSLKKSRKNLVKVLEEGHKRRKYDYYYLKELAVEALSAKDFRLMDKWLDKMIKMAPQIGEAYNIRAISYKRRGNLKRAVKEYERGIGRDPKNGKLHHNLAIALATIGDKKRSRESYRQARIYSP